MCNAAMAVAADLEAANKLIPVNMERVNGDYATNLQTLDSTKAALRVTVRGASIGSDDKAYYYAVYRFLLGKSDDDGSYRKVEFAPPRKRRVLTRQDWKRQRKLEKKAAKKARKVNRKAYRKMCKRHGWRCPY